MRTSSRFTHSMRQDGATPGQYLTVGQAAKLLSVHPSTIRRWIDRGYLIAYRIGPKRIGVKLSDLAEITELRSPRNGEARDSMPSPIQVRELNDREQQEWKRAIAEARELQAEILAKRGGRLFADSGALISRSRRHRCRASSRAHASS